MTQLQHTEAAGWRDYKELTKPNVVLLMILTSAIGMFMAVPGMVPVHVLILGNLGIALCAGAAAAVNHLIDQRVDQKMARTHNRPMARGPASATCRRPCLLSYWARWEWRSSFSGSTPSPPGSPWPRWWVMPLSIHYSSSGQRLRILSSAALPERRPPPPVGVDGSNRPYSWTCAIAGADYFRVDATTFLGTGYSPQGGVCGR